MAGPFAYVANKGAGTVSVIDTSTNAVTATVTVGSNPFGIAITPNGSYAYVANEGAGTVSVIDTSTNVVTATVTVGTQPTGVAITPNGSYAYVANNGSASVSVIDTSTNVVTATVTVGTGPRGVAIQQALTPLAPTLVAPANLTYEDLSGTVPFDQDYNNTDGSVQAGYQMRLKISGASAYSYYNASTSALQSTAVTNASTSATVTLPAGILANGNTYNWSFASYSSYGLLGPFASDFTLVGQAPPTVGMTGPTGTITNDTTSVTWAPVFPSGASQTAYQIWVYAQSTTTQSGFTIGQTTGLIWGSGLSNSSATSALTGPLPNGQTLVFYLQLTETGNEVSPIASTTATVSFTPPAVPLITATATTLSSGLPVIQIDVTGQDNLLSADDASFEGGIGTWFGVNTTLAQGTTGVTQGSYALEVTVTAAGAASAQSAGYPVIPGNSYTALGMWLAASTASTINYNLVWLDSSGTVISQASGATMTPSGSAIQLSTSGVAPANAATARPQLYINNGAAAEIHSLDAVGIFPWVTDNLVYDSDLAQAIASVGPTWKPRSATIGTAAGDLNVLNAGTSTAEIVVYGTGNEFLDQGIISQIINVVPGQVYTLSAPLDFSAAMLNAAGWAMSDPGVTVNYAYLQANFGYVGTPNIQVTIPAGVTQVVIRNDAGNLVVPAGSYVSFGKAQLTQTSTVQPYEPGPLWTPGGFVGQQQVTVTRSDGLYVRGASNINPAIPNSLTQAVTIYDAEAVPGDPYTYTATVTVPLGSSSLTSLASGATASQTIVSTNWWEFDPTDLSTAVNAQPTDWSPVNTEQSAAHMVTGTQVLNMVADTMLHQDFSGTFEIFSNTVYVAFQALLKSQKTVFISSPWGDTDTGYFRVGPQSGGLSTGMGNKTKNTKLMPSTYGAGHRTVQITAIAQNRPNV